MHRILFITIGTRGDVQPYIALATELINKGHEVGIATHYIFEEFISSENPSIRFFPLKGDINAHINSKEFVHALYEGSKLDMMKAFASEEMINMQKENMKLSWKFVDTYKPTGIVCGVTNILDSLSIAQGHNVPLMIAATVPYYPSAYIPPIGTKTVMGKSIVNSILHSVTRNLIWLTVKKSINEFRKAHGIAPAVNFDINCAPILGNYSSIVVPHPDDYPSQVITTGYWILNPKKNNQHVNDPNANLIDRFGFEENGRENDNHHNEDDVEFEGKAQIVSFLNQIEEKPIYMGFGSMPLHSVSKLVEILLNVCIKLSMRAIFCGRYTDNEVQYLEKQPDGGRILLIKGAPHEWLLPQCSMAIHHGGAGTTAASMRACIPTIIYPVLIDQPFWAARVVDLKVGQNDVCELRNITEKHLQSQIQHCLKPAVINQAIAIGEKLRKENGCDFAAQKMISYFDKHFKNPSRIVMKYKEIKWMGNGNCGQCLQPFGLFNSAANCMVCGDLYCANCLRQMWMANYGYVHQNVCVGCDAKRK